jgi:uncharacterized protein
MKNLPFVLFFSICLSACRTVVMSPSSAQIFALRLHPGQDLKKELDTFARENQLQAGFIVTCVGSLRKVKLRLANQPGGTVWEQKFEIVSLVGTLSPDGSHLHLSVSDSSGVTLGGHLMEGCEIYTTAEIVIGEANALRFRRETDPETTFKELTIENIKH